MMVARIGDSSEAVVVGSDAKPEMARLDDNNALRSNGLGANFTPTNLPLSLIGDDKGDSVMSTPNLPCETPSRSIRASPKLVFMSDRKSVPTEIKGLQERTIKRRRDFLARMHELVSKWMNKTLYLRCREYEFEWKTLKHSANLSFDLVLPRRSIIVEFRNEIYVDLIYMQTK